MTAQDINGVKGPLLLLLPQPGTIHAIENRLIAQARALGVLRRDRAADRLRPGGQYATSGLVFADQAGRPVWPDFTAGFAALCKSAGIGRINPRELRHTFVSVMPDSGVPIEDIADLAGHINSGITRSVYRHVIADKLTAAATVMDDPFRDVSGS